MTVQSPLLTAIDSLCAMAEVRFDNSRYVKQAFLLGLWHESFPEYMLTNVTWANFWEYEGFHEKYQEIYSEPYVNLQRFQFISDTGDSWHQCYRDLRSRGWKRLKVHRKGGRLQYLLHNHRLGMPDGYQDIHLVLDISISTCKPVKIGTKIIDVFETQCEDLVELSDDQETKYSIEPELPAVSPPNSNEEFASLLGVSNIEESESRCDHGNLSGCCGQSDCSHFMGHEDPEPSVDHYDNMAEQGIIVDTKEETHS